MELKNLSLGELISRLHSAILSFIETIDQEIIENKEIKTTEVSQLRNHIRERLERGENPVENKKLLQILDAFATNAAILELAKEDAEQWLKFLDAIEKNSENRIKTSGERKEIINEIKEISRLTAEVKEIIRKG